MRLDPFTDPDGPGSYNRDPAATWRRLLDSGQHVGYDDQPGVWLIAGHDNVRGALSDTRRFSNAATLAPILPNTDQAAAVLAGVDAPAVAVNADAPVHTRTRAILRSVVPNTAERAEQKSEALIAERVDQLTHHLADAAAPHQTVDLMQQFAARLPLLAILDVLGVPVDLEQIPGWSDGFVGLVWGQPRPGRAAAGRSRLRRARRFSPVGGDPTARRKRPAAARRTRP